MCHEAFQQCPSKGEFLFVNYSLTSISPKEMHVMGIYTDLYLGSDMGMGLHHLPFGQASDGLVS